MWLLLLLLLVVNGQTYLEADDPIVGLSAITVPDEVGRAASIVRLYLSFYLREPDQKGLMYWIYSTSYTMTVRRIADAFANSNEFKNKYLIQGVPISNLAYVKKIYQNVFDRDPDSSGLTYWTRQLDTKAKTRGEVMLAFSESSEFLTKTNVRVAAILAALPPEPRPTSTPVSVCADLNLAVYQKRMCTSDTCRQNSDTAINNMLKLTRFSGCVYSMYSSTTAGITGTALPPVPAGAVNPKTYGAIGNGVFDNTKAFQRALDDGHVYVTAGTYLIKGQLYMPHNRILRCESPSKVTLRSTLFKQNGPLAMINMNNTFGSAIIGCTLYGVSTVDPIIWANSDKVTDGNYWESNYVIHMPGSSRCMIINNVIGRSTGDGAIIATHLKRVPASRNIFRNNNFITTGLFGLALTSASNNLIFANSVVNAAFGHEPNSYDDFADTCAGNIFAQNVIRQTGVYFQKYPGAPGPFGVLFSAGFTVGDRFKPDCSLNWAIDNDIRGPGSKLKLGTTSLPVGKRANYVNNHCEHGLPYDCAVQG